MSYARFPRIWLRSLWSWIALSVLLAGCFSSAAVAQDTSAAGKLIELRGKQLYVEVLGPADAPPLLYLHGGPGSGSYEFGLYQGQRLAKNFRLILMDQRGVLRSDPLGPNESFGLDDIIEDAEALRVKLGYEKWSVLGHSFGGYVAARYAILHPDSIDRLVFDDPTFDLASSARSLLLGAAREYALMGKKQEQRQCLAAARGAMTPVELWKTVAQLTNALGDRRNNLYVHGPDKKFFDRVESESKLPKELWGRGGVHQEKLFNEGKIFESLLSELAQIRSPALLIHGRYDLVTAPDQVRLGRSPEAGS
jgi:proline iminopeptidase